MTHYNSVNVNLSDSQLNKLKSATKNETGVNLTLSSNKIGTNETNFPLTLILSETQVSSLHKAFTNHSDTPVAGAANIMQIFWQIS